MAQSPSHQFGQIIGELLEQAIRPIVREIADEVGAYLDAKDVRRVRGAKRKVAWEDAKGNTHDLDYVFEFGGNDESIGTPAAFIEVAWRRYTKHSRNKAQEIQGAILPLAERYREYRPFLGVVLGGVFTQGSLAHLRSNGFVVLHFPYESVIGAFASVGMDARFDEETPDSHFVRKIKAYRKLSAKKRETITENLRRRHAAELMEFAKALRSALTRKIVSIYVLPLHGSQQLLASLPEAIAFIESYDEDASGGPFARYEVGIRYGNGDEVRGQFNEKATAIAFLRTAR